MAGEFKNFVSSAGESAAAGTETTRPAPFDPAASASNNAAGFNNGNNNVDGNINNGSNNSAGDSKANNIDNIDNGSEKRELSDQRIAAILRGMGKEALTMSDMEIESKAGGADTALIVSEVNKTDKQNVVNEAVEKKMVGHAVQNFFLLKPVFASIYRAKANSAVRKAGNTDAAFKALKVEAGSKVNKDGAEYVQMRARLALDEMGFGEKTVSEVDARDSMNLNKGEHIESVGGSGARRVNEALKDLFTELSVAKERGDNKGAEEARKRYDEKLKEFQADGMFGDQKATLGQKILESRIVQFVAGDHSKRTTSELDSLKKAADGVEVLVEHKMAQDRFEDYVDKHVSLYNASMKEGVYTKQKVNSIMKSIAVGGLVGGVAYTLAGWGVRSTAKAQVVGKTAQAVTDTVSQELMQKALVNGIAGGAAGAAFGAVRGAQRAGIKMSEAEIKAATSAEAIVTPEERARAAEQAKAEATADAKDRFDLKIDTDSIPAAQKKEGIFRKIGNIKKKATGEGKYIEALEERRDRKSAKELYDKIERQSNMLEVLEAEDGQRVPKLKELAEKNPDEFVKMLTELSDSEDAVGFIEKYKGMLPSETMERLADLRKEPSYREIDDIIGGAVQQFMEKGRRKLSAGEIQNLKDRYFDLFMNPETREVARDNLMDTLAEVQARNDVSADRNIDLISYSKGNVSKERYLLAQKATEARGKWLKERKYREIMKNKVSKRVEELEKRNKQDWKEKNAFVARQALVDGITGGLIGGAAGAILTYVRTPAMNYVKQKLTEHKMAGTVADNAELPDAGKPEMASTTDAGQIDSNAVSTTGGAENVEQVIPSRGTTVDVEAAATQTIPSRGTTANPEALGLKGNGINTEGASVAAANEIAGPDTANIGETASGNGMTLEVDEDGGYAVIINGEKVIGDGDEAGIHFDAETGQIDNADLEILRERVGDFTLHIEREPLPSARAARGIAEYFSKENTDYFNENAEQGFRITNIENRTWLANDNGSPTASINIVQNPTEAVINEGDIVLQVAPNAEGVNVGDLQVVLTPSKEMASMGVVLDVADDGTVIVPADSVAASMFSEGGNFNGGYLEVVQASGNGDGGYNVLSTLVGANKLEDVQFTNTMEKVSYTYDFGGTEISAPTDVRVEFDMHNVGAESLRDSGPISYAHSAPEATEELLSAGKSATFNPDAGDNTIIVNGVADGDATEALSMPVRSGNFSEINDPFFSGEKDSEALNGPNLIRALVDPDREMSDADANAALVEAVENGNLSTDVVLNRYLEQVGNSPEQITEMRAMLGDFKFDIDGDGTEELIDTAAEVNAVADILKNSAEPEGYSAFVNDTFARLYDKLNGGEVRLVNYSDEPYDYTTLGYKNELNNVIHLFARKKTACSGIGIEFLDEDGESIYDFGIARKLWGMPSNAKLTHITERLNCCQKTADVNWIKKAAQAVANEQPQQIVMPTANPVTTTTTTTTTIIPNQPGGGPTPSPTPPGPTPTPTPPGPTPTPTPPGPTPPDQLAPKTDYNPWGNDANPNQGLTPEMGSTGGTPIQAGQENFPVVDNSGVNTNPAAQQDWAEAPTAPVQDTGTGGTVDQSAGMSDADAANFFNERVNGGGSESSSSVDSVSSSSSSDSGSSFDGGDSSSGGGGDSGGGDSGSGGGGDSGGGDSGGGDSGGGDSGGGDSGGDSGGGSE